MWKLYANYSEGIALKTDFKSLVQSFTCPEDIFIGNITYIDYETAAIPESNIFGPILNKRLHFEHEREVRAVANNLHWFAAGVNVYGAGHSYKVNLSSLVHEVVVAPTAEDWFIDLVKSVAAKYDLAAPVSTSAMRGTPVLGKKRWGP